MIAMVNTSIVPTCFSCLNFAYMPVDVDYFSINVNPIVLSADVTQIEHRLIVANFANFTLLRDGTGNNVECLNEYADIYSRTVTTLSKETTIVYHM